MCAEDDGRVLILDANYVLEFRGITPDKDLLQSLATGLPGRRESAPPPVLAFVPHKNLVVNSAKYLLGPGSLGKIAPQLAGAQPGFDEGAEAHFTEYRLDGGIAKLVLFYYPSPEMARLHTGKFISCRVFTSRTPASMMSARAPRAWNEVASRSPK